MLCETCDKRDVCVKLCEDAEAYVSQDHVSQRHLIPSKPIELSTEDWYCQNTVWDYSIQLSPYHPKRSAQLKNLIIQLHQNGLNTYEIAYHLPCSRVYIQQIVSKFKTNHI